MFLALVEYPSSRRDFGYSFIDRRSMRTIPLSVGIGRDETLVLSKPNLSDVGASLASAIADADRDPTQPFDFPDLLPGCMTVIRPNIDSTTLRTGFSASRLGGRALHKASSIQSDTGLAYLDVSLHHKNEAAMRR